MNTRPPVQVDKQLILGPENSSLIFQSQDLAASKHKKTQHAKGKGPISRLLTCRVFYNITSIGRFCIRLIFSTRGLSHPPIFHFCAKDYSFRDSSPGTAKSAIALAGGHAPTSYIFKKAIIEIPCSGNRINCATNPAV